MELLIITLLVVPSYLLYKAGLCLYNTFSTKPVNVKIINGNIVEI